MKRTLLLLLLLNAVQYLYSQNSNVQISEPKQFNYSDVLNKLEASNPFDGLLLNDSLLQSPFDGIWEKVKNDIKTTSGTFNAGYSYGLNTIFYDSTPRIQSIFNTYGSLKSGFFGLPVLVSFNYSTLKVPLAANNYFRISFDKDRLIENQKKKLEGYVDQIQGIEDNIEQKKSKLGGIQGYSEVYLDMLKRKLEREVEQMRKAQEQRLRDSLNSKMDSLQSYGQSSSDSLMQMKAQLQDSAEAKYQQMQEKVNYYKEQYDSIMAIYDKIITIKNKCDSLLKVYGEMKEKFMSQSLDYSKLKEKALDSLGKLGNEKLNFLKSIKKIDIGLTYPKTTGLSSQSTAIKGVGTEFQIGDYYLAVSSGLTLNNVMLSTNEITNQLNYNQNVFNQFDFQKILNNGILSILKTGWGAPDKSHAHIGFNYLTNTRFGLVADTTEAPYDPAASLEIDLKYVPSFYKGGSLEVIYGRTSANNKLDTINQRGVFESVFSNYRSNTFLSKYSQEIKNWRSDFSIQFRSIDPYANTTVYGMMQPGNRRIAFESRHRISRYFKLGTNYKYEETYGQPSMFKLHSASLNASGSYTEYFVYAGIINHVNYYSRSTSNEEMSGVSYLASLNLSSSYDIDDLKGTANLTYNDYLFADTSGFVKYRQLGLMKAVGNKKWSASLKYDYFYKTAESVYEGTHLMGCFAKYSGKKIKIDGGIEVAKANNSETSIGGSFNCNWQATKFMSLLFHAERFVKGNFYRNYYSSLYDRFPYLLSLNMNFNF